MTDSNTGNGEAVGPEPGQRRRRRRRPPRPAAQTTVEPGQRIRPPTGRDANGPVQESGGERKRRRRKRSGPVQAPQAEAESQPSSRPSGAAKQSKKQPTKRKPTGRGRTPLRLPGRTRPPDEFAAHWWARRWLAALEKFGWAARLERGRDYARRGNVLDLDISAGCIAAKVQGSKPWPYSVSIELEPLTGEQWDRVAKRLGRQALYAAKLLAGDMPQNIEDIFNAADVALIPKSASAFTMSCTCPDSATPCKHIAAVHYVLGAEFDRDPFVLFELRGRTRQEIVKALQGRAGDQSGNVLPLVPQTNAGEPSGLDMFWKGPQDVSRFPVHISPAVVPGGLLRRLGPLPLRGQSDEWRTQLFDVYRLVSRRAYALGRGDEVVESPEKGPEQVADLGEA